MTVICFLYHLLPHSSLLPPCLEYPALWRISMQQSLLMEFLSFLPEPRHHLLQVSALPSGCTPAQIDKVGASGYDLEDLEGYNTTPDKTIDNNFNTRWANYGVGSYIQYELKSSDTHLWHRHFLV